MQRFVPGGHKKTGPGPVWRMREVLVFLSIAAVVDGPIFFLSSLLFLSSWGDSLMGAVAQSSSLICDCR